jgi:Spy/CpxP family protein refolding chaperone
MKNLKVWSGLVTIFLLGVIVGVVTSNIVIRRQFEGFMRGGPGRAQHRLVMETIRGIHITPTQRAKIDSIMTAVKPEIDSLSSEFFLKMEANIEQQMTEVRAVLNQGQKIEFDRRKTELEKKMKRIRGKRRGRRNRPDIGQHPPPCGDG